VSSLELGDYRHAKSFQGEPNQLFWNNGVGTFRDVSKEWGLRNHFGKGMGAALADYDLDGGPDILLPNDASYNFLVHNLGNKFEEVAFEAGGALAEDGSFISARGVDFRDFNTDGYPDIAWLLSSTQRFRYSRRRAMALSARFPPRAACTPPAFPCSMSGYGAGLYDFDNHGWKNLFVRGGHVQWLGLPAQPIDQYNAIFRNPGNRGKWTPAVDQAGLAASPPAPHRGCAFGDLKRQWTESP
jgi:enediyne biosynthesis protein E4